jgi:pimeloyl-ACP methyl ester carboxylesterase
VRGGRSSKPVRVDDYRMLLNVADVVTLARSLGPERVTLIGHDWGAPIVWTSALLRPELFRGVAGLSVPYAPPSARISPSPLERMRALAGADEFYVDYFQLPGRAEAEIEDLAAFADRPIELPALFIGGSRDGPTIWGAPAIARFPETLPRLTRSVVLDGAGHWIQQERPEETNALLLEFLKQIH